MLNLHENLRPDKTRKAGQIGRVANQNKKTIRKNPNKEPLLAKMLYDVESEKIQ